MQKEYFEYPGDRTLASSTRTRKFLQALTFLFAGVAIAALIGLLVVAIMIAVRENAETLLYILAGAFTGGALLFAGAAFLVARSTVTAQARESDLRELKDGVNSFFVGDGTLMTFEKEEIVIHDEANVHRERIHVPYKEMRFFSVCVRTRPRERGHLSVVIEIPVAYLAKEGRARKSDSPALVETDGKERLYRCLEAHGLTLLGEAPERGTRKQDVRFRAERKFFLPNRTKRRNALVLGGLGGALIVGGVLVAIFWEIALGAILAVGGLFIVGRATVSFLRGKGVLAAYDGGLYYADSGRTKRSFLKWEEILSFAHEDAEDEPVLLIRCLYGDCRYPAAKGAYEYLAARFPEKVQG